MAGTGKSSQDRTFMGHGNWNPSVVVDRESRCSYLEIGQMSIIRWCRRSVPPLAGSGEMKVYLDNVIASGKVLSDLQPADEMAAVRTIEHLAPQGLLDVYTSRESWREQDRTCDTAKRATLEQARPGVPVVERDHEVFGFSCTPDQYGGFISNPQVTDIIDDALFNDLRSQGLKDGDARHLMYAACNGCERFVTLDPDFLTRRVGLEARCNGIRIVKPSEFVAELQPKSTP